MNKEMIVLDQNIVKITGDSVGGYSCHVEFGHVLARHINPCPFCGSVSLELCNTHSPSFWIECECGVQFRGKDIHKVSGWQGTVIRSRKRMEKMIHEAVTQLVYLWNMRKED